MFTNRLFSYSEKVLLKVGLELHVSSFRFSLYLWERMLLLSGIEVLTYKYQRVITSLFIFLGRGEIEAIVVPVCLAFLLIVLLGVLFCFNKRDL